MKWNSKEQKWEVETSKNIKAYITCTEWYPVIHLQKKSDIDKVQNCVVSKDLFDRWQKLLVEFEALQKELELIHQRQENLQ